MVGISFEGMVQYSIKPEDFGSAFLWQSQCGIQFQFTQSNVRSNL